MLRRCGGGRGSFFLRLRGRRLGSGWRREALLGDVGRRGGVGCVHLHLLGCGDRFKGNDAGLVPWLVGICRHVVTDVQRVKYRWGCDELQDYASDALGPEDHVAVSEEQALVRAAFARLDPEERELLELRVVAGLSSDEAAAVLDKKPGTVRMAQMRALGRLRTFIQEASRVG